MTVAVTYFLGKNLFGALAGLCAALILALLPIHIEYSQEVRMYALMTFLYAGGLWGFCKIIKEGSFSAWVIYGTCSVLLCYSQGIGALYWITIASVFLVMLLANHSFGTHTWKLFWAVNGLVGALYMPWVAVRALGMNSLRGLDWIPQPSLIALLEIPLYSFTIGPIPPARELIGNHLGFHSSLIPSSSVFVLPILALLLLVLVFHRPQSRRAIIINAVAFVAPIVVLFLLSLTLGPVLIPRAVIPTAVPLALLLGAGQSVLQKGRRMGLALLLLVLGELSLGVFYYHRYHHMGREAWREASLYLQDQVKADECVLGFGWMAVESLRRYDRLGKLSKVCLHGVDRDQARDDTVSMDRFRTLVKDLSLHQGQVVWVAERMTKRARPFRESVRDWSKVISVQDFPNVEITKLRIPIDLNMSGSSQMRQDGEIK